MAQKLTTALHYLKNQSRLLSTEWSDLNPRHQSPHPGAAGQAGRYLWSLVLSTFLISSSQSLHLLSFLTMNVLPLFQDASLPEVLLSKLSAFGIKSSFLHLFILFLQNCHKIHILPHLIICTYRYVSVDIYIYLASASSNRWHIYWGFYLSWLSLIQWWMGWKINE